MINSGDVAVSALFHGDTPISQVYLGQSVVWEAVAKQTQVDYQFEEARNVHYPVMFIGSSTIQGYGVGWSEGFTYQLTARLASHLPGVMATPMVKQTSGSYAPSGYGFHFLNAGYGGAVTSNYFNANRKELYRSFKPRLVIHMVGSNDYFQQFNPEICKNNWVSAGQYIVDNAGPSGVKQLFIHAPRREDVNDDSAQWSWDKYGQALKEAAEEVPDAEFLNASALFDRGRNPDVVYTASDRIHLTPAGNTLLTEVVADFLALDQHEDEVIYGVNPSEWGFGNGTALQAYNPVSESLVQLPQKALKDSRMPHVRVRDGYNTLDYSNGAQWTETEGWDGVHALPITFYAVTESLDNGGWNEQPFFTRSVGSDNAYIWAWWDRGVGRLKAAANTPTNGGVPISARDLNEPSIIAISFLPSGMIRYRINSTSATDVAGDSPEKTNGPWMKSLKIGANTANTRWTEMDIRELYWRHGADDTTVENRIRTLAESHQISING